MIISNNMGINSTYQPGKSVFYHKIQLKTLNCDTVSFSSLGTKTRIDECEVLEKDDNLSDTDLQKIKKGIEQIESGELKPIGCGRTGNVYRFENIAIKEPKFNRQAFIQEARTLKEIPKDMENVQKLLALVNHRGTNYLCTKFINAQTVFDDKKLRLVSPIKPEQFSGLFDDLFKLDAAGIELNDFGIHNLLNDGENIYFIDFGEAEFFEDKTAKSKNLLPTNGLNLMLLFQLSLLLYDVREKEGDKAADNYLRAFFDGKASYHDKRATYMRENIDLTSPENLEALQKETRLLLCSKNLEGNSENYINNAASFKHAFL